MTTVHCDGCGDDVPGYDTTHYGSEDGGFRTLCNRCFSAEVAERCGLDNIDYARLEPIGIADCDGVNHEFHFTTRLLGHMATLEAFELKEKQQSGYEFQVIGEPEEDQFALLGRMVSRIRKTLSIKYIVDKGDRFGPGVADMTVRGRIGCDLSEPDRTACIVVDGQEYSWNEFGRMMSSFEGWQFRLEIIDRSEEL